LSITIHTVDAFTRRPFAGNPAGVCVLPAARAAAWMQAVAAEMNLSETAFLVARADGSWDLRWFTPAVEVDLCGHATLASAHVLWETGQLAPASAAQFHTKSGLLTATRTGDRIEMDFPAKPVERADPPPNLLPSLGATAHWVGRNAMDYLVELADEPAVRDLAPDCTRLARVDCRGVIVTAKADRETDADFVSRFFAPQSGIAEDPVTGSAHCALGPFWRDRLGKSELVGMQVSRRGGVVAVRCAGDRVFLGGNAVTIMRAELLAAD
jgi:predicted PhzF superfamily epimerase YddE/YHI9